MQIGTWTIGFRTSTVTLANFLLSTETKVSSSADINVVSLKLTLIDVGVGNARTCISTTAMVSHLTSASRYKVSPATRCFLEPLVHEGRVRIAAFLSGMQPRVTVNIPNDLH